VLQLSARLYGTSNSKEFVNGKVNDVHCSSFNNLSILSAKKAHDTSLEND
jgi:hypothetical protein